MRDMASARRRRARSARHPAQQRASTAAGEQGAGARSVACRCGLGFERRPRAPSTVVDQLRPARGEDGLRSEDRNPARPRGSVSVGSLRHSLSPRPPAQALWPRNRAASTRNGPAAGRRIARASGPLQRSSKGLDLSLEWRIAAARLDGHLTPPLLLARLGPLRSESLHPSSAAS